MAKSTSDQSISISNSLSQTRESFTGSQSRMALERLRRDEELADMVEDRNRADPNFEWSARYVDGKLRVSVKPK